MSESEGKSAEFVRGYVAGLRWAREQINAEIVEPYHGKARTSD